MSRKNASRKNRKNVTRKAASSRKASSRKAPQAGGKSEWNKRVMEVYRELKSKNPNTRLGDAMREASRRYKK